ncbi:MAG TPA: hypothetical protein DCQ83_03115, partial [Fibrobacteres bacterium]|nr:hypothetical protein [Fibrobacterota bacterium]
MKKSTVFLVFTLLITFVHGQENYSQWTKNKLITLNTTASGANVTGALTKFPLAVQLTASDSDVFKQALPGGADIRFTDSAGTTRYKHQKESWDSAGRTATFWVLLPTVTGNANNYLRIRWGKTGVADSSSGAAVFDTANRFNGVWHMNAGTGNETDATINANVLTPSTSSPTNGVGAVGPGRVFSGTNQYFVASNPSTVTGALDIRPGTPHTVSAWVFGSVIPTASNSGVSIVNKGDHQWNLSVYANKWETSTGISATGWAYVASTNAPTANAWHLIVGTWAGGITGNVQSQLYVDGVLNSTSNQASGNTPKTTYNVFVGAN